MWSIVCLFFRSYNTRILGHIKECLPFREPAKEIPKFTAECGQAAFPNAGRSESTLKSLSCSEHLFSPGSWGY